MMAAKRLAAYARISRTQGREKRGEAFIAESNYREACEAWAETRGVTLTGWYCDLDTSGGKLRGRPKLDEVMDLIRTGQVDGVVTPLASRFSRAGLADALGLIDEIRKAGAAFVPLDVPGAEDPDDANAELALNIWLAIAHKQLRDYQQQWATGKQKAIERGVPVAGAAFGYRHKWRDGDKDLGSLGLEPHPQWAPVVREAFKIAAREGLDASIAYLRRTAPHRRWTATTARRLFASRTYLGEVRYGPGSPARRAHKPLATPSVWRRANAHRPTGRRQPSGEFPLSGLLRCQTCGTGLVGSRMGKGQRAYRCGRNINLPRDDPGRCKAPASVLADSIEPYVANLAARLVGSGVVEVAPEGDASAAETALAEAEDERDRFAADTRARKALGDEPWHAALEARTNAVRTAQEALERALAESAPARTLPGTAAVLMLQGEELGTVTRDLFERIALGRGRGKLAERVSFTPRPNLGEALEAWARREFPGRVITAQDRPDLFEDAPTGHGTPYTREDAAED
jgi:DNA invertase Pin-like site-specific DNA recombinase